MVKKGREWEGGGRKQEVTCHRIYHFEYLFTLGTIVMREEKRIQKTEKGISEMWDYFKWPNTEVIRVSEKKVDRKNIWTNNGQKLSKLDENYINPQIQEA